MDEDVPTGIVSSLEQSWKSYINKIHLLDSYLNRIKQAMENTNYTAG